MDEDLISVIDVAKQHGKLKASIFKIIKRLNIEPRKQRNSLSKNQYVSYISQDEFKRVSEVLSIAKENESEESDDEGAIDTLCAEQGVFYIVQLEGIHDPCRFKVGFAA